jgi:hypothetical protein
MAKVIETAETSGRLVELAGRVADPIRAVLAGDQFGRGAGVADRIEGRHGPGSALGSLGE